MLPSAHTDLVTPLHPHNEHSHNDHTHMATLNNDCSHNDCTHTMTHYVLLNAYQVQRKLPEIAALWLVILVQELLELSHSAPRVVTELLGPLRFDRFISSFGASTLLAPRNPLELVW